MYCEQMLKANIPLRSVEDLKDEISKIIDCFSDRPHIFNLGHGVLPQTNPDMVEYLTNLVKNVK